MNLAPDEVSGKISLALMCFGSGLELGKTPIATSGKNVDGLHLSCGLSDLPLTMRKCFQELLRSC